MTTALALYALRRKDQSEKRFRSKLLEVDFFNGYSPKIDSSELTYQLAGILFGVSKEKGMEILLEPEISKAFKQQDRKRLDELNNQHKAAFRLTWSIIYKRMISDTPSQGYLCDFTNLFCQVFYWCEDSIAHLEKVWMENKFERWELAEHDYEAPLSGLLDISNKPDQLLKFIEKGVVHWLKKVSSDLEHGYAVGLIKNLSKLIDLLEGKGVSISRTEFSGDQKKWELWVGAHIDNDVELPNVVPGDEIISGLKNRLDVRNSHNDVWHILKSTLKVVPQSKLWINVASEMKKWLINPVRGMNNDSPYALLFDLYVRLPLFNSVENPLEVEGVKKMFSNADFLSSIAQESPERVPSLMAWVTAGHL